MSPLLGYHADAEIDRLYTQGAVVGLAGLALLGVALALGVRGPAGRNRYARAAGLVAALGLLAHALVHVMPEDLPSTAWAVLGWSAWFVRAAVFFVAPPLALIGVYAVRRDGQKWVAIGALLASLVLPMLFVAWFVACAVTDACFH